MKNVRKIFAFAIALVMAFAVAVPAFAQDATTQANGTIVITVPSNPAPTGPTTYHVKKVFDATNDGTSAISYRLAFGDAASFAADKSGIANYFDLDASGVIRAKNDAIDQEASTNNDQKLNAAAIKAIGDYVANQKDAATVTVPAGEATGTANVGYGYFYIDTTTGTAVTVTSTNPKASVEDKNSITNVTKSLGSQYDANSLKAIAQVGHSETFTGQITLGKGAEKVVYTDTMTHMAYNGDLKVTVNSSTDEVAAGENTYSVTPAENNAGFTVTFADAFINTLKTGDKINLTYSGKILDSALHTDPAKNVASVTSGDNGSGAQTTKDKPVQVYTAQVAVNKTKEDNTALSGAGFVLKKKDGQADKYYKFNDATSEVEWVNNIADATEHISDDQGKVAAFTGLDNGTYYLEEKTVPDSYNKALDTEVKIEDGNYTAENLSQTKTVQNKKGAVMPSTGGIGTTIFYAVGGVMVVGAVVFLLTKRRAAAE